MADILGYEFETDEEFNELLHNNSIEMVSTYNDNELYEEVIDNIDSTQMAGIIYQMMDNENFKGALLNMGMVEEFNGETYIDGVYMN